MKVTVEKPEIIALLYQQERLDADYGSCLWARFYLDTKNYTMSIESDCGNYSYGWVPTPNSESFLHLLSRMDSDYLLGKLADRSVVNGDATWQALKELVEEASEYDGIELNEYAWERLKCACYHQRSADDVFSAISDALKYTEFEDFFSACTIYECVEMDYHPSAKKIVSVFQSCIVPVLRGIAGEVLADG